MNFNYVGFPRSGSHWLRIALEHYTGEKSPISDFIGAKKSGKRDVGKFKGTHDYSLTEKYDNVIYLYRNPVDSIYSQIKYNDEEFEQPNVQRWLDNWNGNVQKWVYEEKVNKVILCYENLEHEFCSEFSKLLRFMNINVDEAKMLAANEFASKRNIKNIVIHDEKVINTSQGYDAERDDFRNNFGVFILENSPHFNLWKPDNLPTHGCFAVWKNKLGDS